MKLKKEQGLTDDDIIKMVFTSYDENVNKFEPYGSMIWNGSKWVIDVDSENKTLENYHSTNLLANKILTLDDYELYVPLVHAQSKLMFVKGITKKFYDDNQDLIKNNPLLKDGNGYLLSI